MYASCVSKDLPLFLIKKKKVTLTGTLLQGIVIDMNNRGFTGGKNGVYSCGN